MRGDRTGLDRADSNRRVSTNFLASFLRRLQRPFYDILQPIDGRTHGNIGAFNFVFDFRVMDLGNCFEFDFASSLESFYNELD